jgi:hypothetical protein
MELEIEDEFINTKKCIFIIPYIKPIPSDKSIICTICNMTEVDEPWERYSFSCGHAFHSRCIRTYCNKKGDLACPYRCKIGLTKKNRYCNVCSTFGHCPLIDPEGRKCFEREMKRRETLNLAQLVR